MPTIDHELATIAPVLDSSTLIHAAQQWLRRTGSIGGVIGAATLQERAELVGSAIQHVTFSRETGPTIAWHPWAELLRRELNLTAVV
jgi:hypothetical protein